MKRSTWLSLTFLFSLAQAFTPGLRAKPHVSLFTSPGVYAWVAYGHGFD